MKLNQTQEAALEKLKLLKSIRYDCATKGQAREQNAALQLAEKMPKKVKATWHDFRYFTVELIGEA